MAKDIAEFDFLAHLDELARFFLEQSAISLEELFKLLLGTKQCAPVREYLTAKHNQFSL